jgi:hypothetical protein
VLKLSKIWDFQDFGGLQHVASGLETLDLSHTAAARMAWNPAFVRVLQEASNLRDLDLSCLQR